MSANNTNKIAANIVCQLQFKTEFRKMGHGIRKYKGG